jgi:hypothetical protein
MNAPQSNDEEQFRFAPPLHVGELHAELSGSEILLDVYKDGTRTLLITKPEARELLKWLQEVLA